MLILLSASKKKIGSFVTPTIAPATVGVFSTDSSAFKYGSYTMTVFPSFKKDGGAFAGGAGTDTNPSALLFYTSSDGFKYASIASTSAFVSYRDAGALNYTMNPERAFNLQSTTMPLMYPPTSSTNAMQFTFEPFKIFMNSVNTTGTSLYFYNSNGTTNPTSMYSPYSTSTYNQTLSIQPESF